jgi:hypothetical protein
MSEQTQGDSPWALSARQFPVDGNARDRLLFLLRYAILAPSTHNTQPWRFTVAPERILVFRDRARWLQVADPSQRELHVSVGCALENLLIAAIRQRPRYVPKEACSTRSPVARPVAGRFDRARYRPMTCDACSRCAVITG